MASPCQNCGEPVALDYCPACGQPAAARRGPLLTLLGELFSELFSLDGRHLRTALALAVPGKLTRLYLDGKRASYAPPPRVYVVASLLFFLLIGFPTPDAERYNVWVDDYLIGRDEPDPELPDLSLLKINRSQVGLSPRLDAYVRARRDELLEMSAQELVERFVAGLERTVPTALICFVPILALALKLVYLRQPFFYVDHLVFALHFQSFLFVLFVLLRFANDLGLPVIYAFILVPLLAAALYLFLALRRVYGQSWLRTLLKTAALGVLYMLLVQPVMGVTFLLVLRGI